MVPLWQGADDDRVTTGPLALARVIEPGRDRRVIPAPPGAGPTDGGVRHLEIVAAAHVAVRACLTDSSPSRLLVLGSDCAIETPAIAYLVERYGELAVAWFDAHPDLNTPESSPSGAAHGMALRLLLGEGHPDLLPPPGGRIRPSAVVLAGARAMDPAEAGLVVARGLARVTVEDMERDPALVRRSLPAGLPVYVHLDVDVLDPRAFPAAAWPVASGLGLETAERVLDDLFRHREVVGVGVMEFVPAIAHEARTLRRLLAALGLAARD